MCRGVPEAGRSAGRWLLQLSSVWRGAELCVTSSHPSVQKAGLRSPCGPSSAAKAPESSQGAKMSCHPTSIPCRGPAQLLTQA